MKRFICFVVAVMFVSCGKCEAQEDQPTVIIFETTTPCDILTGVGIFLKDTGDGIVGGVKNTAKGLGEIISSPFKARVGVHRRRYLFQPPEIRISPGKLEEIKPPVLMPPPPKVTNPPSKPVEKKKRNLDPSPLYFLPTPNKYRLVDVA